MSTACQHCPTCSASCYSRFCGAKRVPQRPIMVIGESVTAYEARNGSCLTGPGGGVIKETLEKVGLPYSEDEVFYTTALACAVPKVKGKQIPTEPMLNCRNRLLKEIQECQPKLLLVMGKTALITLTGDPKVKVSNEYARPRTLPYCGDAIVLPIMNPGLILRSPGDYKPFLASLHLAKQLYGGESGYDPGVTKWIVLRNEAECLKAIETMRNSSKIAADIETTSLDYRIADFACMGMCFERNKVFILPRALRFWSRIFFEQLKHIPWTWHHGKYDAKIMWRRGLGKIPFNNDTIYRHYTLDETTEHNLGYLTKAYMQAEEYKYKMNQNFKAVTLETMDYWADSLHERCAVDCDWTYQLDNILADEMNQHGNECLVKLYDELIMPASDFLLDVEYNGMLINPEYLGELDVKYVEWIERLKLEVEELVRDDWDRERYMDEMGAKSAPDNFNPASSKQMSWLVFKRLELKPRIKKGGSTDVKVLESIPNAPPIIQKVLEYRRVQKEHSTYVIGLLNARDVDGRVRSNFGLHITATGRLSSKEPNLQNIPSAKGVGSIRKAFIPAKGKILMEIDYSGAELRWLAYLSGCPVLKAIFIEGRNLHDETAKALFGQHYTKVEKMRAKAVNFGIPYGREEQSFVDEFGITFEEAQQMIQGWLNNYYGARDYLDWCAEQALQGNYLETPWGRRRRAGLVSKESLHSLQNEFRNMPIQSSSSDLLLYVVMKAAPVLKSRWNVDVLNLVHDSTVLELDADLVTMCEVASYLNERMVQTPVELFDCDVPFKTDVEFGCNWHEFFTLDYETGKVLKETKEHGMIEMSFDKWKQDYFNQEMYEREWYQKLIPVESTHDKEEE